MTEIRFLFFPVVFHGHREHLFPCWQPQVWGRKVLFLFSLKLKPGRRANAREEKGFGQTYGVHRPGKSPPPSLGLILCSGDLGAAPSPSTSSGFSANFPAPASNNCLGELTAATQQPLFLCLYSKRIRSKLERLVCLVAGVLLGVLWLFYYLFFFNGLIG